MNYTLNLFYIKKNLKNNKLINYINYINYINEIFTMP